MHEFSLFLIATLQTQRAPLWSLSCHRSVILQSFGSVFGPSRLPILFCTLFLQKLKRQKCKTQKGKSAKTKRQQCKNKKATVQQQQEGKKAKVQKQNAKVQNKKAKVQKPKGKSAKMQSAKKAFRRARGRTAACAPLFPGSQK